MIREIVSGLIGSIVRARYVRVEEVTMQGLGLLAMIKI